MSSPFLACRVLSIALLASGAPLGAAEWQDPSSHRIRSVVVDDIQLEVLDWGGRGPAVVLLAGGGNTAHVFDGFAEKLARYGHVFAITCRGFGASGFSMPAHPVDRLRDDVLAVLDALHVDRVVLIGHSIAGVELSAVAQSAPGRIAGLVYLEAAYPYAFNNGAGPSMEEFLKQGPSPPQPTAASLGSFSSLQKWDAEVYGARKPEAEFRHTWDSSADGRPTKPRAAPGGPLFMPILTNGPRFAVIPRPALMIFARPHREERWIDRSSDPGVRRASRAYLAALDAAVEKQARAIEAALPAVRVVRLPGAHHVFLSNEGDVIRETRAFLASLKPVAGAN